MMINDIYLMMELKLRYMDIRILIKSNYYKKL